MKTADALLLAVFVGAWVTVVGSAIHYGVRVKPRALKRWADGLGCEIVEQAEPGFKRLLMQLPIRPAFLEDRLPFAGGISTAQQVHRMTLRDAKGRTFRCWVKIGRYWMWPQSVETCPIEVRWEGPAPGPAKPKEVVEVGHPLRDREIDG